MQDNGHHTRQPPTAHPEAWLLLGPTGVGKTPLGEALEAHGWYGRPCRHLDFGQALRDVEARGSAPGWPVADVRLVGELLHAGRLLEDDSFNIAERIVRDFLAAGEVGPHAIVILNGLPRHIGQAAAVAALLTVRRIVLLDGPADTVRTRIRRDTGGDRAGRRDDDPVAIERKLAIFRDRTQPLIDYYAQRGVPIHRLPVAVESTALDMLEALLATCVPLQ